MVLTNTTGGCKRLAEYRIIIYYVQNIASIGIVLHVTWIGSEESIFIGHMAVELIEAFRNVYRYLEIK